MGNMSVNVSIKGEGLDPIDPLLDPTMGNMSVNVSIKGEGLDPIDPLLDPTMGTMSVNASILKQNKTICRKPTCESFSLFRCHLRDKKCKCIQIGLYAF